MSSSPPIGLLRGDEQNTILFRRGPWQAELRAGELENIRHSGRPVLRSIRVVVRDQNWRTLRATVDRVDGTDAVDDDAESALVIDGHVEDSGAFLRWSLTVTPLEESMTVALRAEASSDFLRNRLGLIVLHSPTLAGRPFTVRHPDADPSSTTFPVEISPHQPAVDISGLAWVGGDERDTVDCRLDFAGDVFEMEDQRNWTDASYKTYSTPLSVPFPVAIRSGDVIEQSLVLHCASRQERSAPAAARPSAGADAVPLFLGDRLPGTVIPRLLTMASSAPGRREGARDVSCARQLVVELDPTTPNWLAALDRALSDAGSRPLDVRIVAAGIAEAEPVLDALAAHPSPRFARIGVFGGEGHLADADTSRALVAALDARGLDILVIAGTRAHFTELNRGIHRLESWRGPITFSVTPFMHDTSGHQLVESIPMQREVVANARRLAAGRPMHVGPITLGARFNAVATTPARAAQGDGLQEGYGAALVPGATDPRTSSPSLAAWLLASVEALSVPSVLSLCYLEEWGPRSATDAAAHEVLTWLSQLEGSPVVEASAPGLVTLAVAHRSGGRLVVLLANLDSEPRAVRVPGEPAAIELEPGEVRRIHLRAGSHLSDRLAEE